MFQSRHFRTHCVSLGVATLAAVMWAGSSAHAAPIATYSFVGDTGTERLQATTAAADLTADAIAYGAGVGSATNPASTGFGNYALSVNSGADNANLADAVAANIYFDITLTPHAGYKLSLNSLSGIVARSASSSTRGWQLRSSADSYVAVLAQDASISASSFAAAEAMTPDSGSLNLASVAGLQNLTGPVTLRIYVSPNDNAGGGRTVFFDDLTIDGSVVAVPEPATLGLIAVGGLLLAGRKCRIV